MYEISALPPAVAAPVLSSQSAGEVAAEFDAMVWAVLLRESGLLAAFDTDAGAGAGILGELLLQDFARHIAEQFDLGFGRMAISSNGNSNVDGGGS